MADGRPRPGAAPPPPGGGGAQAAGAGAAAGAAAAAAAGRIVDALRATRDAPTLISGAPHAPAAAARTRPWTARPGSRLHRRAAPCGTPGPRRARPRRPPATPRCPPSPATGLRQLRRQLRGPRPAAARALAALLRASPGWGELQGAWDAAARAGAPAALPLELLQAVHDLLRFDPGGADADGGGGGGASNSESEQDAEEQGSGGGGGRSARAREIAAAQDALARSVLQRRLKSLYFNLSSGACLAAVGGWAGGWSPERGGAALTRRLLMGRQPHDC
jgi:hypothetical protein